MQRIGKAAGGALLGMLVCGILTGFFSDLFGSLVYGRPSPPTAYFVYPMLFGGLFGIGLGSAIGAAQIPKKLSAIFSGMLGLATLSFGIRALPFSIALGIAAAITGYIVAWLTQIGETAS